MEDASPSVAQSTMSHPPASASFLADSTIPQTPEDTTGLQEQESEVPATPKLMANSEVEAVQTHPEQTHVSDSHLFPSQYFWDVDLHMRLALPSQLFNRFFPRRHLRLIGLTTLLLILGLAIILPAFHWQALLKSIHTQNHYGSSSTTAQAQTTGSFQDIYMQATSGTPVINDSLAEQSNTSWDTYHEDDGASCAFIDRALRCTSPQGSYSCSNAQFNNFHNLANLAIEVSATIIQGDLANIFLRWNGDTQSGYRLYFSSDGRYTFEFLDKNDDHVLISQSSSAIHTGTGQSNIITIIARGNNFYLFINKQYVNSVSDETFHSGQIAMGADGRHTDSEVAFSNVRVWQL